MHPAVQFFQRFQSGLLADVISCSLWTLAGDQQCANKLPEKCGPVCDALVEVRISLIIQNCDFERSLLRGLIVVFFSSAAPWVGVYTAGARAATMSLDGSRTVLIGFAGEALWHEGCSCLTWGTVTGWS